MTIGEKRDFIHEYCIDIGCNDECRLCVGDWSEPLPGCTCLNLVSSPEEDLDRAIALINGEDDPLVKDDPVNHPSHYTSGGIECIDAIAASMTNSEYEGFLKGQVIKYVWRYRLKGKALEDLKKARFYLEKLIQTLEKEEVTV